MPPTRRPRPTTSSLVEPLILRAAGSALGTLTTFALEAPFLGADAPPPRSDALVLALHPQLGGDVAVGLDGA